MPNMFMGKAYGNILRSHFTIRQKIMSYYILQRINYFSKTQYKRVLMFLQITLKHAEIHK